MLIMHHILVLVMLFSYKSEFFPYWPRWCRYWQGCYHIKRENAPFWHLILSISIINGSKNISIKDNEQLQRIKSPRFIKNNIPKIINPLRYCPMLESFLQEGMKWVNKKKPHSSSSLSTNLSSLWRCGWVVNTSDL